MDLEQGATIPLVEKEEPRMEEEESEKETMEEEGSRSSMNLAMLTDKSQLQTLASLLRSNEEALMRRVMKSEQERVEYITTVTNAYRKSMALLDDCAELLKVEGGGDDVMRARVARDVHDYVVYGLNLCMQNVRNCCMRVDLLDKLRAHYDNLAARVAHDPAAVAAEASQFRSSMWEYCYSHRSTAARAKSSEYSKVLKMEGVDLPELLRRHQLRLGYLKEGQDFEDLTDSQKLEVYNSVITASGRAKLPDLQPILSGRISATTLAQAVSVFIMAAGNLVYDVFTTEHKVEAILKGSLSVMAALGAFAVEAAVTAAVTKAVALTGAGLFACSLAGFVVGAIAGLIFIVVSGRLIDLIIGSPRKVPPLQDLKFHTAVMPDGMDFANQIAARLPLDHQA